MTADRAWSAIGSSNFDNRSFETNDAISMSNAGEALTGRLDASFERYLRRAQEVELLAWMRRGPQHRVKDHVF